MTWLQVVPKYHLCTKWYCQLTDHFLRFKTQKWKFDTYLIVHWFGHSCNSSTHATAMWAQMVVTTWSHVRLQGGKQQHILIIIVLIASNCILFSGMLCWEGCWRTVVRPDQNSPKGSLPPLRIVIYHLWFWSTQHFPHHLNILIFTSLYVITKLQNPSTCPETTPLREHQVSNSFHSHICANLETSLQSSIITENQET